MNKPLKPLEVRNQFLIEKIESEDKKPFIIGGYVRKFGKVNENGEQFSNDAYDEFIEKYYEKNSLHIPVDVMHGGTILGVCGKVVLLEKVKTVGVWCEIEISKNAIYFNNITGLINDGILQGLSDYGYATDYEYKYNNDGTFSHCIIKKQNLLRISIVDAPAEGTAKLEVMNATKFKNFEQTEKEKSHFLGL